MALSLCYLLSTVSLASYWITMRNGFEAPEGPSVPMRLLALGSSVHAVVLLWHMHTAKVDEWRLTSAAVLMAGGLALFVWARRSLGAQRLGLAFSGHGPQQLVTQGPWQFIRHPHYTAYLLTWGGMTLATGQPTMVVGTAAIGLFYVAAARQEDRQLRTGRHAQTFATYSERVGMFLPRIRLR